MLSDIYFHLFYHYKTRRDENHSFLEWVRQPSRVVDDSVSFTIRILTYVALSQYLYTNSFGIVLPLLLYMPFWFIPYFQIYNTIFIFAVLTTPILTVFKCLEGNYTIICPWVYEFLFFPPFLLS